VSTVRDGSGCWDRTFSVFVEARLSRFLLLTNGRMKVREMRSWKQNLLMQPTAGPTARGNVLDLHRPGECRIGRIDLRIRGNTEVGTVTRLPGHRALPVQY